MWLVGFSRQQKECKKCAVLFSFQGTLFCCCCCCCCCCISAATLISYHNRFRLSTTFLFFLFRFCDFLNHFQATACLLYHTEQPFVKNFFQVFSLHFSSHTFHIPPGLSSVFNFASAVLATKIILSPHFQIVNVFLVFYLIRTIQTIYHFILFLPYTFSAPEVKW